MAKEYYTTSEAARMLSVSPDTVLKWVKGGRIQSFRTPGGHCRIPRSEVTSLLPGYADQEGSDSQASPSPLVYQYCWNFYAEGGAINEECLGCVAYKSRARRCYEMRHVPQEFGHLKLHCESDCDDCDYYQLMVERGPTVLIVSGSNALTTDLAVQAEGRNITLGIADGDYECALMIEKLRPDYVVIDCSFGRTRTRELCRHLNNDSRIPLTRIILASKTPRIKECCDSDIFAWIRKPFSLDHLSKCISATGISLASERSQPG
jgi:excisionase family DNA binding protein